MESCKRRFLGFNFYGRFFENLSFCKLSTSFHKSAAFIRERPKLKSVLKYRAYGNLNSNCYNYRAIWLNMIGISFLLIMCAYAGLVIFAFYDIHECDPIKAELVDKPDQLFPLFVMQVMGDIPCVPGLFVAGVFSGALSTVSSGMNSLAAVTIQDIIIGAAGQKLTESKKTLVTKVLALLCGLLGYALVFVVKFLPGVLEVRI